MSISALKEYGLWAPNYEQKLIAPYIKRLNFPIKVLAVVGIDDGSSMWRFHEELPDVSIVGIRHRENKEFEGMLIPNQTMWQNRDISINDDLRECHVLFVPGKFDVANKLRLHYHRLVPRGIVVGTNHTEQDLKEQLVDYRRHSKVSCPINILDKHVWFWWKR